MSKPNPDDRRDNAERIRKNIESTRHNIEAAEEIIRETSDDKTKRDLQAKNERRARALPGMEQELLEESIERWR